MNARLSALLRALACSAAATALILPVQRVNAGVLIVTAKGRIDPACEISVATPLSEADFASSGIVRGGALINCNTGFVIKATSANGAVKNDASVSPGFTNSLRYTVSLGVGTVDGFLYAKCSSASLVAGQSTCSLSPDGPGLDSGGSPSARRAATLTMSWNPPVRPRLVAGSYQDTITISVAAAP